jgi:hypothetical protein
LIPSVLGEEHLAAGGWWHDRGKEFTGHRPPSG